MMTRTCLDRTEKTRYVLKLVPRYAVLLAGIRLSRGTRLIYNGAIWHYSADAT